MEDAITRAEHAEFARRMEIENKRIEDENERQNRRIEILEESVRQIGSLTAAVEKLAVSIQGMATEQEKQGKRLETLESRDGEKWRKAVAYVLTALAGLVVGIVTRFIGI